MAEALYVYPRFSLAERDRRWKALRETMARDGVDCVITPHNTGHSTHFQAESRYLTHCGGGGDADVACVFPFEGEVAAIATSCERWRHVQDWVTDLREARRAYGRATAEKLREVKLPRRRVGVVGLEGYVRAPEGTVLYGFMKALTEAFPEVEWVNFTDQLQSLRMVKSEEEISFLRKSTELVDRAFRRVQQVARPGVKDYEAWGAAMGEICKGGSEIPVHNHWGAGLHPSTLTRPTHGELQRGYLIVNEIEAAYGGYHAQGVQPLAVQECARAYQELMPLEAELWQRSLEQIRVGITVGQAEEIVEEVLQQIRPRAGLWSDLTATLTLHGRGLGSDAPMLAGDRSEKVRSYVFTPGWVFVYKPGVRSPSQGYGLTWGDTVLMMHNGAVRLGDRPLDIMYCGLD